MQDILDRGLGSEDRKTLRKLASVGGLAEGFTVGVYGGKHQRCDYFGEDQSSLGRQAGFVGSNINITCNTRF